MEVQVEVEVSRLDQFQQIVIVVDIQKQKRKVIIENVQIHQRFHQPIQMLQVLMEKQQKRILIFLLKQQVRRQNDHLRAVLVS